MNRPPDGPLLALDTSTATGSVAVGDGDRLMAEVVLGIAGQHSKALMPAVDSALSWAGLTPRDLRGVVVSGGPGSFTGLRIGAATAKGIVHALGLPMWSYSGLMVAAAGLAPPSPVGQQTVCAVFDARRREVFAALYGFRSLAEGWSVDELTEPEVLDLDTLLDRFRGGEPPIFTGDGARVHADELRERLGVEVAPSHMSFPRASSLLWLSSQIPDRGRVADPVAWEPFYLRESGAERIAARLAGGA